MIENSPGWPEPLFIPPGRPPSEVATQNGRPVRILASGGRRVTARLIDTLVVTPLTMMMPEAMLMVVLFKVADTDSGLTRFAMGVAVSGGFVSAIGGWFLARVVRLVRYGCTVGQRIAGIRVVRLKDGVRDPSWSQALRRWMVPWGSAIGRGPLTPFGDLMAYWRDNRTRQCAHDQKSETVVVLTQSSDCVHRIMLGLLVAMTVLGAITFIMLETVK